MLADSVCFACKLLDSDGQACLACELVNRPRPDRPLTTEDGLSQDESTLLSDLMVEGDLFSG